VKKISLNSLIYAEKNMEKLENKISYDIRGAIFNVYKNLGPGLLESVYEHALAYELVTAGRKVKT
jgi:hypothetical protein